MIPEPTTVVTSSAVPRHSAARRLASENVKRPPRAGPRRQPRARRLPDELSALRRQQVENRLRGAAKAEALRRHDQWPVYQDRVRLDGVEQPFVGERRVAKPEVVKGRALFAQDLAHCQAGAIQQLRQEQPRRRAFEVFDNVRLDPGIADHREHVARSPACRIVIDDDIHHATSGLGLDAPSSCPISRSFAFSDILSRLLIGRLTKIEIRFLR
jgi:hypothetical protein